jgi:hypothetical protein
MMTESAALISAVNRWISTVNQFKIPADSALKAENDPEQDASGVSEISGGGGEKSPPVLGTNSKTTFKQS